MENPIFLSKKTKRPFVYYHTHRVYDKNLEEAIDHKKSIELDIAFDSDGTFYNKGDFYIGHPVSFYTEFGKEFYKNMLLEDAVKKLEQNPSIFVVLDCKNIKAIPKMKEIVKRLGSHRCLFHAFIKEWTFEPLEANIEIEPHWKDEDIPLKEVLEFKQRNKVPIIGACRGFSAERLNNKDVVSKVLASVKNKDIDCISLYMPGTELPPLAIARQITQAGYLNWINVDKIANIDLSDVTYIGMTDILEKASDFENK